MEIHFGLIAMVKKGNDRADQDSPWKLILRQYFQEVIEFFFPDSHFWIGL